MKKICCKILLVIFISQITYGQEIQSSAKPAFSKEDFLFKSKRQKTIGTIVLIGGSAAFITGMTITMSELSHGFEFFPEPGEKEINETVPAVLSFAGLAGMVTGGILLDASKKNKKRAMSMTFRNETIPGRRPAGLATSSMAVASLSIRF